MEWLWQQQRGFAEALSGFVQGQLQQATQSLAMQGTGLTQLCTSLGSTHHAVKGVIEYLQGVIPLLSGRKDVEKGLESLSQQTTAAFRLAQTNFEQLRAVTSSLHAHKTAVMEDLRSHLDQELGGNFKVAVQNELRSQLLDQLRGELRPELDNMRDAIRAHLWDELRIQMMDELTRELTKVKEAILQEVRGNAFIKLRTQVLKDVQGTCNALHARIRGEMSQAVADGVAELRSAVSLEQTELREAMTRGGTTNSPPAMTSADDSSVKALEEKVQGMDSAVGSLLTEIFGRIDKLEADVGEWDGWYEEGAETDSPIPSTVTLSPQLLGVYEAQIEPIAKARQIAPLPPVTPAPAPTWSAPSPSTAPAHQGSPELYCDNSPQPTRPVSPTPPAIDRSIFDTQRPKVPAIDTPVPNYLKHKRSVSPPRRDDAPSMYPQAPLAANTAMGDMHLRGLYPSPFAAVPGYGYPPQVLDGGVLAKLNAHYKFPVWNGQADSWRAFVRDWEGACRIHSPSVQAPLMKALIFLESVPLKYQQLFRAMLHEGNWGFGEMWGHVEDYVARNLPLMKEVEAWEAWKPRGRSLEDYLDWYREFVRMGNSLKDGAVTEFHWMAAFRRGLMHKALFEREFVKLKDREKQEGREYDLAECNNFVMQELRNRLEVQQYKNLYGDRQEYSSRGRHEVGHLRGMGGTPTCSHCLKGGHTMETCWALHPHLKPSRPPTTPDYTPQSRGGGGHKRVPTP